MPYLHALAKLTQPHRPALPQPLFFLLACLAFGCGLVLSAGLAWGQAPPASTAPESNTSVRSPVLPHTRVFVRSQYKYGLERNYMRRWIDRPLLLDRSLENVDRVATVTSGSFGRMFEVVNRYELDGVAWFPETANRFGVFELARRTDLGGLHILPEFIATEDIEAKSQVIEAALASPAAVRVGDRVLITSYSADRLRPEQWKKLLDELRARHGDTFLFVPAIAQGWSQLEKEFHSEAGVSPTTREQVKAALRSYLDIGDGIYFASASMVKKEQSFDAHFYEACLIPTMQSVLAEPPYRKKLFGLSATHSHFNPQAAQSLLEDGTKTLRRSFEAAMAGRPDFIIIPEWDEQNEHTSLRPTVDNSFASQRIVKHYMRQARGLPPAPNPGDDPTIANLIVSYRKVLVLGESLEIEILNVPDGQASRNLTVTVELSDADGQLVHRFPPARLSTQELHDVTLALPTETLAAHQALVPTITIDRGEGEPRVWRDGLHPILLRTTWNSDLKWVKQPLRDLAQPTAHAFELAAASEGEHSLVHFNASFEAKEELASVEILEDNEVVYAFDPRDEFLRGSDDRVLFAVEWGALTRQPMAVSLQIRGADWQWPGELPELPRGTLKLEDHTLSYTGVADWWLRSAIFAVSRNELADGVLELEVNGARQSIPLPQLFEQGIYSLVGEHGLTVTLSHYYKQFHHPYPIGERRVAFSASVRPELPTSVFHLRAITKSGRVWRSQPVLLPGATGSATLPIAVYSDTQKKPVTLHVAAERVPQMHYAFDPSRGGVLYTEAGRPFWGHLGGYINMATGQGGNENGLVSPFRLSRHYPDTATRSDPEWVEEDGQAALKFDGRGNYIVLPVEALPRRSGFTLSFEIKPTARKEQVLFIHSTHYIGSIRIDLNGEQLTGSYTGESGRSYRLTPGLKVATGQWSTVEVICDQAQVRFRVNGQEGKPSPIQGPGLYLGMSAFGGHGEAASSSDSATGNPGWFQGYLRSLTLTHAVP